MFAHDADLRLLGVSIFKPVGEPVRVCISHDYDLDCSVLARRRWRCARVIWGLLSFRLPRPFSLPRISRGFPLAIAPKAPRAITPEAAEGIVRLLALLRLLPSAPEVSPELRVGRNQKG